MMNFEEIKKYWEDRAAGDSSAQSTTQDFYLREIEFNVLSDRIQRYSPRLVADVGCGDGRTTARLASLYPNISFTGIDYSSSMIENAHRVHNSVGISNMEFYQGDICVGLKKTFNLIYTTRCLINIPTWDIQKVTIKNIYDALNVDGVYLMVENFIDGHDNFNEIRKKFGLEEIKIREHNMFFERERLLDYVQKFFKLQEEVNISSTYYLMSRIIYSKICAEENVAPDYFDDHHRFAAGLPFCGEFGPVRLLSLKKR